MPFVHPKDKGKGTVNIQFNGAQDLQPDSKAITTINLEQSVINPVNIQVGLSTYHNQQTHSSIGESEQRFHVDKFHNPCERRIVRAAFNSSERPIAPKCLPNTRDDVKQEIRRWFGGAHKPPICWLNGQPGSGKSAIAETIAQQYKDNGELAASFFFDRRSTDRRDITNFVPTIAFQLSIAVPQTKALMQKAFERDPSILDRDCNYQFMRLIVDPLLELEGKVSCKVIILDGLDQYGRECWVNNLLILLIDVCRNHKLPLRFCLTSRANVECIGLPDTSMKWIFSLALENFDAQNDIRILFETEFAKMYRRHHLGSLQDVPEPWPSHADVNRLVAKSSGLFILASIIVKFVDDGHDNPQLNLQKVLISLDDQCATTSTCQCILNHPQSQSFVDCLVRLLASDDASIQIAAVKGLECASTTGSGAGVAANSSVILSLVGLLQSEHIFLLTGVCRVLFNISTSLDSAGIETINAIAIPSLIRLLSSSHISVQRSAISALMKVTLHDSVARSVPVLDAIPVFVQHLSFQDTKIQAATTAVLRNITASGKAEDVVKAKAIPSLINLLDSRNPVVLIAVCATLKDITSSFDDAPAEAVDANVMTPLVRLLYIDDLRVQKSAIFALMCNTLHESSRTAALPLDLIPKLVRFLGSNDIHLQALAAATLENITVRDRIKDVLKAKAIPHLVHLLISTDPIVLFAVCAALKSMMSISDSAWLEALDANVIPPLVRLLSSDDNRVRRSAVSTLKSIVLHSFAGTTAISLAAIPQLVRLLASDDFGV